MKKIISIILAAGMVVSMTACSFTKEEIPTEPATEATEEMQDETVPTDESIADGDKEMNSPADTVEPEDEKNEPENTEEENTEETLGNTLLKFFNEKAKEGMSAAEIAEAISTHPAIEFSCMTAEMEQGYLPGFDEEITAFDKAVSFAPVIGSIAFVGYVFEAEDTDALVKALKASANLRWNICVEAEEMVTGVNGNKVFFVMCPKTMEE